MTHTILFVEDDLELAGLIGGFLEMSGFTVQHQPDGSRVVDTVRASPPDLVLLDIMLPGKDGLTLCRELRAFHSGPIVMLTSLDSDSTQIEGLETGASDYVIKTTPPAVLLARLRAQLRSAPPAAAKPSGLTFGQLVIDEVNRSAAYAGEPLNLSTGDFDLLLELARNAGTILSRDHLLRALRGIEYDGLDRSIDVAISRLRKKLDDDPTEPRKIKTIRHKGYLFATGEWW
ncbi:winged helix-turn-helix domain-containing protein [Chitinibacteraceae bacterium HSL-7]